MHKFLRHMREGDGVHIEGRSYSIDLIVDTITPVKRKGRVKRRYAEFEIRGVEGMYRLNLGAQRREAEIVPEFQVSLEGADRGKGNEVFVHFCHNEDYTTVFKKYE